LSAGALPLVDYFAGLGPNAPMKRELASRSPIWCAVIGAIIAMACGTVHAQPAVRAVDLAVGGDMACARMSDASVRCWGVLGSLRGPDRASSIDRVRPVTVAGLAGALQIVIGDNHGFARMPDGTVRAWGAAFGGRLGNGRSPAVGGGGGGRIHCTGEHELCEPTALAGLRNIVEIVAGRAHACARARDGAVSCWGVNESGQVGDDTVVERARPTIVRVASGVTRLFAGGDHTCAVTRDGKLRCWGVNYAHGIGDTSPDSRRSPFLQAGLSGVVDAALGWIAVCARLRAGGEFVCWGQSPHGEVPDGVHTFRPTPTPVPALRGALAITMGNLHGCARMGDSTVRCWGSNTDGMIGDGTTTQRFVPTAVSGLARVEQVAVGDSFSCARTADGRVLCWGRNTRGQLGDGTTVNRPTPTPVAL